MDEQMNGKSPHLQDFVPYRGRCPASPHENKEKEEQGKGTADHLMPLGYLLSIYSPVIFLGSGLDRGLSPIEWGNFLSISPFIQQPDGPMDGPTDRPTNRRTHRPTNRLTDQQTDQPTE